MFFRTPSPPANIPQTRVECCRSPWFWQVPPVNEHKRRQQIELAVGGDSDALQGLIIEYHAPLRTALEGMVDPAMRRHLDPDDVLQEAYAAAFKTIGGCRFDGPPAFYKWLERIALNELKDQQRALKRQKRDITREVHGSAQTRTSYPDLAERLVAPDSTPSRRVARGEAVAAVLSSLARLTDEQREVVRLRYLESKPVSEVAAHMGKTEVAIHSLCRRALKALRESMASISHYLTRR